MFMIRSKAFYIFIIMTAVLISGCSEYNKVLKSSDIEYKYSKTMEYYNEGEYYKAYPLIEELIAFYRGTDRAEKLYYIYAYSDYYLEDYLLASHRFDKFVETFPRSDYAKECQYMAAYCQYKMSPNYSLDQDPTRKAIDKLQLYINDYPKSKRADTCTQLITELETKLEYKRYNAAKQYLKMEDYRAAYTEFDNLLSNFPDTKYREEAYFLVFKARYKLAVNSIESKKEERIDAALKAYITFVDRFPDSKSIVEAEKWYSELQELKRETKVANKS